jgi:hypothetical protein
VKAARARSRVTLRSRRRPRFRYRGTPRVAVIPQAIPVVGFGERSSSRARGDRAPLHEAARWPPAAASAGPSTRRPGASPARRMGQGRRGRRAGARRSSGASTPSARSRPGRAQGKGREGRCSRLRAAPRPARAGRTRTARLPSRRARRRPRPRVAAPGRSPLTTSGGIWRRNECRSCRRRMGAFFEEH